MIKRTIRLGSYDTAANLWTLSAWSLSPAEYKQTLIEVPGRIDGPLDYSTAQTEGEPVYTTRQLVITLETSEGTRLERKQRIREIVNLLDGRELDILLPDEDRYYLRGRVKVALLYNDPAHASVQVTATCAPWLYAIEDTVVTLTATAEAQTATLMNDGRRPVLPTVAVTGSVNLTFGSSSWVLSEGSHLLPDLYLPFGAHEITYSGDGTLTISYREGVLE